MMNASFWRQSVTDDALDNKKMLKARYAVNLAFNVAVIRNSPGASLPHLLLPFALSDDAALAANWKLMA